MNIAERQDPWMHEHLWQESEVEYSPHAHATSPIKGACWYSTESQFALHVPGIARCAVHDGGVVQVQMLSAGRCIDPRPIVQGLPLAARFVQRGLFVLHASAIATSRGAVLLVGHSGAGKSTLTASFAQRGYSILADQITPMDISQPSEVSVLPAMTDVLLWQDSAEELSLEVDSMTRPRAELDRYLVPSLPCVMASQRLHALYILSTHDAATVTLTSVRGQQRVTLPIKYSCNRQLAERLDVRVRTIPRLSVAFSKVRIGNLYRPDSRWTAHEIVDLIEQDLGL